MLLQLHHCLYTGAEEPRRGGGWEFGSRLGGGWEFGSNMSRYHPILFGIVVQRNSFSITF